MKNLSYALIAALIAGFATSSLIALATAAPSPTVADLAANETSSERELVALLDARLNARLSALTNRLHKNRGRMASN